MMCATYEEVEAVVAADLAAHPLAEPDTFPLAGGYTGGIARVVVFTTSRLVPVDYYVGWVVLPATAGVVINPFSHFIHYDRITVREGRLCVEVKVCIAQSGSMSVMLYEAFKRMVEGLHADIVDSQLRVQEGHSDPYA